MRRVWWLAVLMLVAAGCAAPRDVRTASDENATACATECPVTVTPTTPFEGVAGTPEPTATGTPTPVATPVESPKASPTPTPEATPAPQPAATPAPTAAPPTNATPTPEPTTNATPTREPATNATPAPEPATIATPTREPATNATPSPEPATIATPTREPATNATPSPEPATNATPTPSAAPIPSPSPSPSTPTSTPSVAAPSPQPSPSVPKPVKSRGEPRISVGQRPLHADGSQSGARWGDWSADPGARRVGGASYLAIQNVGNVTDPVVTIQFDQPSFVGTADASWLIPIAGNVEFAAFEDSSPTPKPADGTFVFQLATGSAITLQFHGQSDTLYVAYRVVSIPSPLPDQAYAMTYQVSVS